MFRYRLSRHESWFNAIIFFCFLCYLLVDLSNGQLTPNNNTPLLTQALSGEVMLGIYICVFMFNILFFFVCENVTKFYTKAAEEFRRRWEIVLRDFSACFDINFWKHAKEKKYLMLLSSFDGIVCELSHACFNNTDFSNILFGVLHTKSSSVRSVLNFQTFPKLGLHKYFRC